MRIEVGVIKLQTKQNVEWNNISFHTNTQNNMKYHHIDITWIHQVAENNMTVIVPTST